MKSYKSQGIVLHTVKYGESAMVAYLLTDTLGRQSYMVQGVKSSRGKGNKTALYQPMFVLDFVGLESPKMEMHRMKDVHTALTLSSLPFDARKSTISLFMAEVLYRLVREVEPDSPLFGFVRGAVEALEEMEEGVANFHLWFLVRLSAYLGFYPGNEYMEGSWFDMREGLFTPIMPAHGNFLGRPESDLMHRLMEAGSGELAGLRLSRSQRSDFLAAMLDYFSYHLDAVNQIRSVQILREVF